MKAGGVGSLLILAALAYAALLHENAPDLYRRSVQEDEALEWASFWAFMLASILYLRSAWIERAATRTTWPWFSGGLSFFCFFVAMEEISWGQRLLAYRPPSYFLEHNFQQELNLHNVVDTDLRQAAFLAVVLGYGVLLPALRAIPAAARLLEAANIRAPHWSAIPGFVATAALYVAYPWSHSGEWSEAMLGLGLLATAAAHAGLASVALQAGVGLSSVALGLLTTQIWWLLSGSDPERVAAAEVELQALGRDFAAARTRTRCGLHKRVFSLMRKYDQDHLLEGDFAKLTREGLPEDRAAFFLDPWNSPYWVRHECSRDRRRRAVFVYSFGANRMRDSSDWEIVPDDLGAWVSRPRPLQRDAPLGEPRTTP